MGTSYLFQARAPGTVMVTKFKYPTSPAVLSVRSQGREFGGGTRSASAILTQVDTSQQVNVQFMPTLADLVYVYSFGDRMGEVTIQGLSFLASCSQGSYQGIEGVFKYYDDNRAVKENRIITVTIGKKTTIRGYLTEMRTSQSNTEMRMTNFTLRIAAMPRRVGGTK
jgi:hypothetical protein